MLFRVYRALDGATDTARGGPLFVPRERQGAGRHDDPRHYGAFYAARSAHAAVAETIQVFRGRDLTPEDLEMADGSRLSLATLRRLGGRHRWWTWMTRRCSCERAGGRRGGEPRSCGDAGDGTAGVRCWRVGLSWWSTLGCGVDERDAVCGADAWCRCCGRPRAPQALSLRHPVVVAAADHLALPLVVETPRRR